MSLSVERLRHLLAVQGDKLSVWLNIANQKQLSEAERRSLNEVQELYDVYAELLAIKEEKPIAYIGNRDADLLAEGMTHAYVMPTQVYGSDIPLIRKPE